MSNCTSSSSQLHEQPSASSHEAQQSAHRNGLNPGLNLPAVVIGGGTGANSFVSAFANNRQTTYVLPVSDDGGSSAEIQRVLMGGPSLGDVR